MNLGKYVVNVLQDSFDLPFSAVSTAEGGYIITPTNEHEEYFDMHFYISDDIRLSIEIKPQTYARELINTMNMSSDEMKLTFCDIARCIINRRGKLSLQINDDIVSSTDYSTWPEKWNNITCRITRMPIFPDETDDRSRMEIVADWVNLATSLYFALIPLSLVDETEVKPEGKRSIVTTNKYERNPANRNLCLAIHGYKCAVCGFDFEKTYGSLGHHFIEVHHIVPVSSIGHEYKLKPETDLIPLCSNCHAMIHRHDPALLPIELKRILNSH